VEKVPGLEAGRTGQLEQDGQDRTAGSRQSWQDRWDRPSGTGHLGPDNGDRIVETGGTGQVRLAGTLDRTERTERLGHDNVQNTYNLRRGKGSLFVNIFAKMFGKPIFRENDHFCQMKFREFSLHFRSS
jgi:hypothetical protein